MDNEQPKPERDPREPLTFDTFMDYQGNGQCAGSRMTSYLNAIYHYDTVFERILQATNFEQLKKELIAFRHDRHLFAHYVTGCWNKETKKYIEPPKPPT